MNLGSQTYQPPLSCKVYTPSKLAEAMITALASDAVSSWLEPSAGRGVFLEELNKKGVKVDAITGVDLDSSPCPADRFGRVRRGVDFLAWCVETSDGFDRVVANPPYVSLLDLPERARSAARRISLPSGNGALPGRSNLWAAFLMGAVRLLKPGAGLAFVLPAAWDYADYAETLRLELPKMFEEWFTLRCEEPIFPDVSEGAVVIIGRGFGGIHVSNVRILSLRIDDLISQLARLRKNGMTTQSAKRVNPKRSRTAGEQILGDLVDIRLGGVTGDVDYFLMTESRRRELGLPTVALKPALSKASHLQDAFITRDIWTRLRDEDRRVWLFRPSKIQQQHSRVRRYLRLKAKEGGCDRDAHKITHRKHWYRVQLPRAVDGFMSGMCINGPWLALSAMPHLTATNTLYIVRFQQRTTLAGKAVLALALLSSPVREQLPSVCRRYAAGLAKFEPGDLNKLRIPKLESEGDPVAAYRLAVRHLLDGDVRKATEISDRLLRT